MSFILQPWQLYFLIMAGWINRQQQEVIEYLRTENQVLKEKLGKGRILLSDDQRRRLAVKGRFLGRKRLEGPGTLCIPETILRWRRLLVAKELESRLNILTARDHHASHHVSRPVIRSRFVCHGWPQSRRPALRRSRGLYRSSLDPAA